MKQLFSFLFLAFFFVACRKETNSPQQNAEKTVLDVAYGSDAQQKMDVYLPANRTATDTKVLIMIHGGAWTTGDKADFNEYIPVFKQRLSNYALFNINYRLGALPNKNPFPTQENDVKAAVDFALSKAEEFGFNKDRLAVLGASAGAHLALLQCYKNGTPKVKALIDMFGPTDMVGIYNSLTTTFEQSIVQGLMGGTPTTNAALYQSSSPINFVSAQSPPTLILHGGKDPLVPTVQSVALKDKLAQANVPVQLVIYPNEEHGWVGASLTDSYSKIAAFLNTYNP